MYRGRMCVPARAKEALQACGPLSVCGCVVVSQSRQVVDHVASHGR